MPMVGSSQAASDTTEASRQPLRDARAAAAATQRFERELAETRHAENWLEDQLQPPARRGATLTALRARTARSDTWL